MQQLVSIIIPSFNRSDLLERAIKSILNQSYKNYEIIIVDNNSTDNTKLIIQKYKDYKIKFSIVKNNGVIALSRNVGLKNSNGELIAFLDSDDWWEKDKLKDVIKVFDLKTEIDLIYHNCYLASKNSLKSSNCRVLVKEYYRDLLVNGNTLITSSVVFKKEILNKVGFFCEDKNRIGWEDYDLWLRIAKYGFNFHLIKNKLGFYWIGEDNFDNPERILINLENIEHNVIAPYLKENNHEQIWWIDYTRAVANYKLKNKELSYKFLKKVIFYKSPIIRKLKAIFYVLMLRFV